MGERKNIYAAMVDGATEGRSDRDLFSYIIERCPNASARKILRAAVLGLEDPKLIDRNVLNTILAFAVKTKLRDFDRKPPKPRKSAKANAEDAVTVPSPS
ncbi:hypothetical protein J5J10_11535 [Ciceribacter sp. L1K23]|uniref:hypothetical protein n=1 Tax=Ciceribacter sp. L1K23 TaxID=2820276 RepID=UPI001B82544F|nr:hypothetical protein [Ciceribacter sp. L1K23]MBR0556309.1 hypothetical protein [Ciceribacter sp. L1K23]